MEVPRRASQRCHGGGRAEALKFTTEVIRRAAQSFHGGGEGGAAGPATNEEPRPTRVPSPPPRGGVGRGGNGPIKRGRGEAKKAQNRTRSDCADLNPFTPYI